MRTHKRGYQVVALAVAGMLLAAGCGGGDNNTAGDKPGGSTGNGDSGSITVRGCKPQNPLIPTNTNETCGGNILDAVTAKLVRYNPDDGSPENDIAESIESKDAITYTIKIKHGVKFHDGTEVKAKNFVDAWNFGAYGPNAQLSSYFFEVIKGYKETSAEKSTVKEMSGLKVVDDYTFKVVMDTKNSTFPVRLGYTAFAPLPDSFFADNGAAYGKLPIGAGPYKMTKADPDREFVLEAVPGYDRPGKAVVKNVTFKVFQDSTAAYNEVVANQLDMTDEFPTSALTDLVYKNDLGGRFVERVVGVFQAVNFPSPKADKSYDNVKLRQAISMAINRQEVIDVAFAGTREPATGWVSPVVDGYKAGACNPYCDFNPEEAKKLYKESGGHEGPIRIGYNGDADHKPWVEATCNSIKNVLGVECLASPTVDFATFRTAITKREQKGMFRAGWQMDYPSIENFLAPLYGTGAGSNDGDYSNKAFDAKLREAAAITDPAKRNEAYQAAELMLAKDMPSIPLWYSKEFIGFSNKIASMKQTVFGTYDLSSIVLK
ncbi:MAG TPA: ABC transporter substrate-binding protein [Sporichthya sp.]|nr:ABC transporter substrate-binding protein [Sporichthya sp.]